MRTCNPTAAPWSRGILDEALAGRLDFIDTIIFPHTCDSIQRLSDIWRLNIPQHIHADLVLPVKLNTASAGQYLVEILNKLKNDLGEAFGVEITESAFGNAVRTYNRIRSLMMELYELRCEKPGVFKGRDFHGMIRAAAIMERTELARSLSAVLNEARKTEAGESESCRIILTGSVCNRPISTASSKRREALSSGMTSAPDPGHSKGHWMKRCRRSRQSQRG